MSRPRQTPTREHDLRMHLGVILMALQMLKRAPATPLQTDQSELLEIIHRAAKAMEALLAEPAGAPKKKSIRWIKKG
jgi:light-regulated signal transduction histidine kinase (bacteriophytochrome)